MIREGIRRLGVVLHEMLVPRRCEGDRYPRVNR